MNRITLIQNYIDKYNYTNYLEIGVHKGLSFLSINCRNKRAVDPFFQIDFWTKAKWYFKLPSNWRNKYFEITSDDFFEKQVKNLKKDSKLDIVFIDGLHTFKGSLNDVLNSLQYLNNDGVIILHDCFPPNKAAATPANSYKEVEQLNIEGWNGLWCGDVWKTIKYLKMQYPESLDVFVLNADFGLGNVKVKTQEKLDLNINIELFKEINKLDYDYLVSSPDIIIGLQDDLDLNNL